jgi:pyruvate,water dikinase
VSAGGSEELERLKTIADDPEAMRLLSSDGDPSEVLAQLRALGGETGDAVAGYLDLVGFRPLDGFDISEPGALELPDALLQAIRITIEGRDLEGADVSELTAQVRARVPEEHREEFDELLGEARLTYRLRDERGVYSDIWASGLMRRAALAAGRRVAARGAIDDPQHMGVADIDEMRALVTGTGGPSAEELAARARYRATHTQQDAPPFLGDPPQPPPDPSGLPPGPARIMRATGIALDSLFGSSDAEHDHDVLRGLAASPGVYEGPARLIAGPSEFGRIQQGDVLHTPATTEAFNILLPLLGAIVTDNGGLLSHSAIVAREYGIPGVVGTREATSRISDGTRVRVDGAAGEVTVL